MFPRRRGAHNRQAPIGPGDTGATESTPRHQLASLRCTVVRLRGETRQAVPPLAATSAGPAAPPDTQTLDE